MEKVKSWNYKKKLNEIEKKLPNFVFCIIQYMYHTCIIMHWKGIYIFVLFNVYNIVMLTFFYTYDLDIDVIRSRFFMSREKSNYDSLCAGYFIIYSSQSKNATSIECKHTLIFFTRTIIRNLTCSNIEAFL